MGRPASGTPNEPYHDELDHLLLDLGDGDFSIILRGFRPYLAAAVLLVDRPVGPLAT
jgi:hypothetical protein